MNTKIKIFLSVIMLMVLGACKDFEELQLDPNRTTEGTPGLLLTGIEVAAFSEISVSSALTSRQLIYTQTAAADQYYNWQRADFSGYNNLRQVVKMEEEAERVGIENYKPLAAFFKSYFIVKLTQTFGDVPYSEALQGVDDNFTPMYDRQEDIYLKVLDDLKEANNSLSPDKGIISGDIIYGGNIENWKKLINSFSLRVLMSLSHKEGNTSLNIKERFNEIISNPDQYPVFEDNSDNAALPFYDIDGNRYPFFNSNSFKTDYYLSESFVGLLKERQDPRLFSFGEPTPQAVENGLESSDFSAYEGGNGSAPLADNVQRMVNGEISAVDNRFHSEPVNEPSIALGYAEVEFTIAEAAYRGWISEDAGEHYNKGIEASMQFYGISQGDIDQYLQQENVQYDASQGLEMIITQKYLAFFMNSDWEAFYNHRRTGFPEFSVNGGGVLNNNRVPKRWMYPESEFQLNTDNVLEAVSRQYPEGDNINGVMWILQD